MWTLTMLEGLHKLTANHSGDLKPDKQLKNVHIINEFSLCIDVILAVFSPQHKILFSKIQLSCYSITEKHVFFSLNM